ncbi:MAG: NAD(P)/FAD-dependent oxidoreductase [Blastocatellia bacterium]
MSDFDVIILGGGPAGMSALIWCHSLALRGVLLERNAELGGQMLLMYHRILDYPGLPGLTGAEMRDRFVAHLNELQLDYRAGCNIEEVNLEERRVLCNGVWLQAKAIILATGASKRKLGIPGEDHFSIQGGISYSATRDHSLYAGKKVCVIGGGDSAVENALILSRICPQVTLIHRSDQFRARTEWFAEAQAAPNITILTHIEPKAIEGAGRVERIILEDVRTQEVKAIETEGVFIRVGIAPNTELFHGQIEMDDAGFIKTDHRQQTSVRTIYAIGDVCRPACLSVASAVGHGAIATREIASLRGDEAERLRRLILDGINSGEPTELTQANWDAMEAEVVRRTNVRNESQLK